MLLYSKIRPKYRVSIIAKENLEVQEKIGTKETLKRLTI